MVQNSVKAVFGGHSTPDGRGRRHGGPVLRIEGDGRVRERIDTHRARRSVEMRPTFRDRAESPPRSRGLSGGGQA